MRKCKNIMGSVERYVLMFIHTYNEASLRKPYPNNFVWISKVDSLYNNIIVYDIKMMYYTIR